MLKPSDSGWSSARPVCAPVVRAFCVRACGIAGSAGFSHLDGQLGAGLKWVRAVRASCERAWGIAGIAVFSHLEGQLGAGREVGAQGRIAA